MSNGWDEQQYADLRLWKSTHLAAFVVLIWDWFICLDQEVEWMWKQKRNMFTALWFGLRYIPVPMYTVSMIATFQTTWSPGTCEAIAVLPTLFVCLAIICAHSVFLVRTWALYARSRTVLLVLSLALAVDALFLFVSMINQHVVVPPEGHGCLPGSPRLILGVLSWVSPLLFDTLIFGFTLWKTLRFVNKYGADTSLFAVFLRDGVVYYAVMLICYLITIIVYVLAPPGLKDANASFSVVLTLVMTERLLLHLHVAVQQQGPIGLSTLSASYHDLSFAARTRVYVGTFVSEMEAGMKRERGVTALPDLPRHDRDDDDAEDDARDVEIELFHAARESIQLRDMERQSKNI